MNLYLCLQSTDDAAGVEYIHFYTNCTGTFCAHKHIGACSLMPTYTNLSDKYISSDIFPRKAVKCTLRYLKTDTNLIKQEIMYSFLYAGIYIYTC